MALFTVEELREVISVKVLAGDPSPSAKRRIRGISSDSRSIRRGDLFVALKGDRFDGHDFVPAVLAQGAAGAIVHDEYRLPQGKGTGVKASGRVEPFLFGVRDPFEQIIDGTGELGGRDEVYLALGELCELDALGREARHAALA